MISRVRQRRDRAAGRPLSWGRWLTGIATILLLAGPPLTAPVHAQEDLDWNWGELFYGSTYQTVLTVTNDCDQPRTIQVFYAYGAPASPYITAPLTSPTDRKSYVVPPGTTDIPVTIQTPPAPTFTLPPPGNHGVFVDVADPARAVLAVEHHSLPACPQTCPRKYRYYHISGHIHFNTDPPSTDPLAVSPCRIWWDTGRRPADLDRDCTQEIRALASAYRQLLVSGVGDDPAWDWFPALEDILSMSAEELVAMKQRAEAQRAASRVVGDAPAEGAS